MNWKNVYRLMQVERKSGRLLRGKNPTRFKEHRVLVNWPYLLAITVGVVCGVFAWLIASTLFAAEEISGLASGVFVILPTAVLVLSAVFTVFSQIQRSGVKMQTEAPYWLPITWQEHTLASILASLLGIPLGIVLAIVSALLVFSLFTGLLLIATLTSIAVFAAALLTSTVMEILRILQTRFTGAIYKSSGRGAIWVRFVGSLAFLLLFFMLYFFVVYDSLGLLSTLADVQNTIFYVPFVWLGLMLTNFFISGGSVLLGVVYMFLSAGFIGGLYALAVLLNKHFGLYEPPAIRIQNSGGMHTSKAGLLGKLGFSTTEAAIIRKDFKAFTRRRELMTIFITPVIFVLIPFLQSFGASSEVPPISVMLNIGMTYLFPAAFMVMMVGTLIIGQEGQGIWRIYASPISAKNLVKSKYFFTLIFGLTMIIITGLLGTLLYNASSTMIIVGLLEALFLTMALSALSLNIGFIGADFTEVPRPRMARQSWVLINMILCLLVGLVILLPLTPTALSIVLSGMIDVSIPSLNIYIATALSGTIAIVITGILYKVNLDRAKTFLHKAEA